MGYFGGMFEVSIVAVSVGLQATAIFFALRLIPVTRGKSAWILLSMSILTMGIRRLISLIDLIGNLPAKSSDLGYELVGCLGSALMLAGILLIRPMFESFTSAEAQNKKLIAELQSALSKVKTLSGLLPICASCKKVRDDQGYWNQIEGFIATHSDAMISHGICPECSRRLYPDLAAKSGREPDKNAGGPG